MYFLTKGVSFYRCFITYDIAKGINKTVVSCFIDFFMDYQTTTNIYELRREKTGFLPMRKQRSRSLL